MKKFIVIVLMCAASTVLFSGTVLAAGAEQMENMENRGRRHGPPPEAYTACESKSAGDSAQFVGPRGETVAGTCEQEGNRMVLRPNDRPRGKNGGKRQGPPPEAYTACEGKNAGDSAQFNSPRGDTVTGTCEEDNGKLVLRPDRMKRERPSDEPES